MRVDGGVVGGGRGGGWVFFFNDPATTEIYTLSLHDALPILPELIQHKVTAENISSEALAILRTPEKEQAMRERLLKIRESLGEPGVMKAVAKRIADFMVELSANEKTPV